MSGSSAAMFVTSREQQQRIQQQKNISTTSQIATLPQPGGTATAPTPSLGQNTKKRRNLPGTPDPDAEIIALSPKTLMATNRFVCEVCNKGFQREQNLQLHRRGHNLPWKLRQRPNKEVKRRVYLCPEPNCVHHDPSRALGDLTGIKKHYCRKHGEKKWKCDKCSKRYAVQSDWKAHSKTCGTREYRCDCGTLFSRRDSFITHRAFCDALAEETARIPSAMMGTPNMYQSSLLSSSIISGNHNNPSSSSSLRAPPLPMPAFNHGGGMNSSSSTLLFPNPSNTNTRNPNSILQDFESHDKQQRLMNANQHQQQQQQQHMLYPGLFNAQSEQLQMHMGNPPGSMDFCNSMFQGSSNNMDDETFTHLYGQLSHTPGPATTHNSAAQMSATALLQKAAQMGATASNPNSSRSVGPSMNNIELILNSINAQGMGMKYSNMSENLNFDEDDRRSSGQQHQYGLPSSMLMHHQLKNINDGAGGGGGGEDGLTRDFLGVSGYPPRAIASSSTPSSTTTSSAGVSNPNNHIQRCMNQAQNPNQWQNMR